MNFNTQKPMDNKNTQSKQNELKLKLNNIKINK